MAAKLLQFPDRKLQQKTADSSLIEQAISISFGAETYTLRIAATIEPGKPAAAAQRRTTLARNPGQVGAVTPLPLPGLSPSDPT